MSNAVEQKALTFDDVQILDGISHLESRSDVRLNVDEGLQFPVFNAAMDTVISTDMAIWLLAWGGGVIHHRAESVEKRVEKLEESSQFQRRHNFTNNLLGVAVGMDESFEDIQKMVDAGAELIAVKVAAALNTNVRDRVRKIRGMIDAECPGVELMVGNVSSIIGLDMYKNLVDWLCVSQGGGSVCSTRKKTGIGKPTFQAVADMHERKKHNWTNQIDNIHDTKIVADGGLRKNGDIVKAIGAGAHAVMLGGMLAGHYECPTDDEYRGMASEGAKLDQGKVAKNVEGVSKKVDKPKGYVDKTLQDMHQSIQSGIATAGFEELENFIGQARFVQVTSNGVREADEHFNG